MLIVKSQRFDEELEDIMDFIAQDNLYQALKFYDVSADENIFVHAIAQLMQVPLPRAFKA